MEESRELFSEFVSLCRSVTDSDYEVIKLVQRRFNKCNPVYIASDGFRTQLRCTMQQMQGDPTNKYVHIKQFVNSMKAQEEEKEGKTKKRALDLSTAESSDMESLPDVKRPRTQVEKEEEMAPEHSQKISEKVNGTITTETTSSATKAAAKTSTDVQQNTKPPRKIRDLKTVVSSLHENQEDDETKGSSVFNNKSGGRSTKNWGPQKSKPSKIDRDTSSPQSELQKSDSEEERPASAAVEVSENEGDDSVRRKTSHHDHRHHDSSSSGTAGKGSERQIRKLETLLQEIRNEIEALEEKELTLEDLDDDENNYILIDKYKKKFVQVWNKLCAIKGREPTTGRTVERRFRFNGSRYPEINRKVEKFVNKFREFPDYQDIRDIVIRSNNKYKFKFNKRKVDFLATDIFTDVGNKLQERRMEDFKANFGNSQTDQVQMREDPALFDRKLKAKLDKNKEVGKSRLEKVIRKFADRQEDGDSSEDSEENEDKNDENSSEQEVDDEAVKVVKTFSSPERKHNSSAVTTKPQNGDDISGAADDSAQNPENLSGSSGMSVLTEEDGVSIELTRYLLSDKVKQVSKDVLHKILNEDKTSLKSPYKKKRKVVDVPSSLTSSDDENEPQQTKHRGKSSKPETNREQSNRSPNGSILDIFKSPPRPSSPVKLVDLTTPVKVLPHDPKSPISPLVRMKKMDIQRSPVRISTLPTEDVEGTPKSEGRSKKGRRRLTLKTLTSFESLEKKSKCDSNEKTEASVDSKDLQIETKSATSDVKQLKTTSENEDASSHKLQTEIKVKERSTDKDVKNSISKGDGVSDVFPGNSDHVMIESKDKMEANIDLLESTPENSPESEEKLEENSCLVESPPTEMLDKLEVYIDRACDDNYIEILSDEENGSVNRGGDGESKREVGNSNTTGKQGKGHKRNAEVGQGSGDKNSIGSKSGVKDKSDARADNAGNENASLNKVCTSDDVMVIDLECSQSVDKKDTPENLPESKHNEPTDSMEVETSSPKDKEDETSEDVVSSSNNIDQENCISNSAKDRNRAEKVADKVSDEHEVTNSGLDVTEIIDQSSLDDKEVSPLPTSGEKDIIDTDSKVDLSQESVQFIEDATQEEVRENEVGDDQVKETEKGVSKEDRDVKSVEGKSCESSAKSKDTDVASEQEAVSEKEGIDCQQDREENKEDEDGKLPANDEKTQNVPECSVSGVDNDQQLDGKVQESEISESHQIMDNFDNYAKTLLQQAMDKLKEPIVGETVTENSEDKKTEKTEKVVEVIESSSNSNSESDKRSKKQSKEHKVKKSQEMKKVKKRDDVCVRNVKEKQKRKETSSGRSSNVILKKYKKPSGSVIDLTGTMSPPGKPPQFSLRTEAHVQKKAISSDSRHKQPPFQKLKRQGSANSPIVLSDTSGSATPGSSSKSAKYCKQLFPSTSRVSDSRSNHSSSSSGGRSNLKSHSKQIAAYDPDVVIKSLPKDQIRPGLQYTSKRKLNSNYADIIKSVTTKVLSGTIGTITEVPPNMAQNQRSAAPARSSGSSYVNPMLDFSSIKPSAPGINTPPTQPPKQLCRNRLDSDTPSPLIPCATSTPKPQLCRNIGACGTDSQKSSTLVKVVQISRPHSMKQITTISTTRDSPPLVRSPTTTTTEHPTSTQDLSGEDVVGSSGQPPELGSIILLDD